MNFSFRPMLVQKRAERKKRIKPRYKNCRHCGSQNLVLTDTDQFCCDCNWHTCFEYVDRGYMNNLQFAYYDHFLKKSKRANFKIANKSQSLDPALDTITIHLNLGGLK